MSINKIMRRIGAEKSKRGTSTLSEGRNVGSLRRSIETTRKWKEDRRQEEEQRRKQLLGEDTQPEGQGLSEQELDERSTAAERRKKRIQRQKRERSGKPKDPKKARAAKRARAKHKAAFRRGAKLAARLRDALELAQEAKADFQEFVQGLDEDARSVIVSTLEEMSQEQITAWLNENDEDPSDPGSEGDDSPGGEGLDEAGKEKCQEDDGCGDGEDDEDDEDDDMEENASKKESLDDIDSDPVFEMLMKHTSAQVDKMEDNPLDVGTKTKDVEDGKQVVGRDPDPSGKGKVDNPKGDTPTYPDHGEGQKTYDY